MGKYTEQVKYLTEYPSQIEDEWNDGKGLFKVASDKQLFQYDASPDNIIPGCLTQIRNDQNRVVMFKGTIDEYLTQMIRSDDRLPKNAEDIIPEDLPVFEYYQELIDKRIEELS